MSASEGNQADSHADDHAEEHDHGPPPPPEPQTPMWLPAVGALLFLTVGLVWALSTPPKETTDLSAMPATSAAPVQRAPPTPPPAMTPRAPGHPVRPGGH